MPYEETADLPVESRYIDMRENPARPGRQYVIVPIRDYPWVVPFVIAVDGTIVLKTAVPMACP